VLNILKFGRLYIVLQAGKSLIGRGRIFTKAVTGAKGVSGVAEISAGSVNFLLKLTGVSETPLGKEISKYLFYFEMVALCGEVSITLYSKMQKSAIKILDEEQLLRATAKKEGFDDVDELFVELRKVAGVADDAIRKTKKYWDNYTFKDMLEGKKPCFLAGTLIHTTTGLKPIEAIQTGEMVLCYDEIKNELTKASVIKTYTNVTEKHASIKTSSGEHIKVTGQHLFYQKTSGTWIKAHQLKVGMHLYNPITNTLDKIIEKQVISKQVKTYNFEVPEYHNYLVGNTGILAHNANKRPSYKDATKRGYAFYELATLENRQALTHYIGKTTREDLNIRASEHTYEGRKNKAKGIKSYTWWKDELNPSIFNLNNSTQEFRFVQMNEFESAIWERYHIEEFTKRGKETNPSFKLRNRQMPLGNSVNSKTFAKYKAYWNTIDNDFNPCKYF
jgi:hypothetical protein